VIYNNLPTIPATTFQCPTDDGAKATLATEIDVAMRERAPAGWKSDTEGPKGIQVLNALFPIMSRDREATKAIFDIIKNQPGYS
jgi:type I restriction enzyme R subunit